MTASEILAIARKCGFDGPFIPGMYSCNLVGLQSFAAAIAEHCAQVVDARRENVFGRPALELAAARDDIRAAFPAPETKP